MLWISFSNGYSDSSPRIDFIILINSFSSFSSNWLNDLSKSVRISPQRTPNMKFELGFSYRSWNPWIPNLDKIKDDLISNIFWC